MLLFLINFSICLVKSGPPQFLYKNVGTYIKSWEFRGVPRNLEGLPHLTCAKRVMFDGLLNIPRMPISFILYDFPFLWLSAMFSLPVSRGRGGSMRLFVIIPRWVSFRRLEYSRWDFPVCWLVGIVED